MADENKTGGADRPSAMSQRDNETSQRETRENTENKNLEETTLETLSEEALRSREASRYRSKTRELEAQLAELAEKLEAAENSKISEEDRLKREQTKLEKRAAEAERLAKELQRQILSSKAAQKHELPEVLSDLLQGESEEDIEAQAKLVAAALDKWGRQKYQGAIPPNPEGGDKSRQTSGANGHMDEKTRNQKLRETASSF